MLGISKRLCKSCNVKTHPKLWVEQVETSWQPRWPDTQTQHHPIARPSGSLGGVPQNCDLQLQCSEDNLENKTAREEAHRIYFIQMNWVTLTQIVFILSAWFECVSIKPQIISNTERPLELRIEPTTLVFCSRHVPLRYPTRHVFNCLNLIL